MTQAVKDLLARMQAQLPPPLHLRADARAKEQFLADYERVLSGWSKEVLDAAWPVVLSQLEFWIWPRCQQITDACKHVASRCPPAGGLDQQREQALDLADHYVKRYRRRSHLARLAEAEGWIEPLMHFVRESAWVQAQLLCHVRPIGWDASIAKHLGQFHSSQEAFTAFHQTIAGVVDRGRIDVRVPPSQIREWKEQGHEHRPGVDKQESGRSAT